MARKQWTADEIYKIVEQHAPGCVDAVEAVDPAMVKFCGDKMAEIARTHGIKNLNAPGRF